MQLPYGSENSGIKESGRAAETAVVAFAALLSAAAHEKVECMSHARINNSSDALKVPKGQLSDFCKLETLAKIRRRARVNVYLQVFALATLLLACTVLVYALHGR